MKTHGLYNNTNNPVFEMVHDKSRLMTPVQSPAFTLSENGPTDRQTDSQTDKQTNGRTDRHTERLTDRQNDRQTDTQTDRGPARFSFVEWLFHK